MLVVLPCAALLRLWTAIADHGVLWPDEIYQGPEQAHRFAFGYGFIPWEFRDGVRSWIFPGLLGLLFKALAALGVDDGLTMMAVAKSLMALWAVVGVAFAMALAARLAGMAGSVAAGILLATFPPSLLYDPRCTTEAASGPLIVAATFFALDLPGSDRWRPYAPRLAGATAAMATALRPQNGILLAGLLVVVLAARRWKDARQYAIAAAVVALAAGLLDAVTWGTPFHSLIGYVRFNLLEGKAARFGVEPITFYPQVAWTSVGPAVVVIAAGFVVAGLRAPGPALIVLAYVVAHSLVPHKELRFLLPIFPLALSLSGAGVATAASKLVATTKKAQAAVDPSVRYAGGFSIVLGALMAYRASSLTLADLGWRLPTDDGTATDDPESRRPARGYMDAVNRLLARAGHERTLCSLALAGISPRWTGGYTYLHRDVPLFPIATGAFERGALAGANYVIAEGAAPHRPGITRVASEGDASLYRRDTPCGPPPPYYTRSLP
jgi:hypothetical protein